MDACTQNPPLECAAGAPIGLNAKLTSKNQELMDTKPAEIHAAQFTDGPNRAVSVKDGDRDCIAFLLTEETVRVLSTMIENKRKLESSVQVYQEVSRAANFGAGFLEYSETMLAEATSKEEHDQIKEEVNRRQPEISRDVERKEKFDIERQGWKDDLDHSRSQAEDIFEQVLLEAQLMQDARSGWTDSFEASNTVIKETRVQEEEPAVSDQTPAESELLEEFRAARQRLLEAQLDFDSLPFVQEEKIIEYRQLQREGLAQFSESDLDLYHVQMGREITRALIDAEQAYSEACAKVRGLGLLEIGYDQESGLGDCTNYDCSSFIDQAGPAASFNPSFVEAWADEVCQSHEEDMMDIAPETDDWEARTVTMSDSVSVVAAENERKQIDRWRDVCEGRGNACDALVSAVPLDRHIF
ncbi:MAG: hypothetical protein Q9191_007741 [Dirinaria sp. TL-2023a]